MTRSLPDDPAKPGLDILNRYLRPMTPEEMDRDRENFVRVIRDRHQGETVVCLGTGPSLRKIDLERLRRFPTIGCNGIGQVFQPDYYVIADPFIYGLHQDVFLACPGTRILSTFTHGECDLRLYYKRENLIGLERDEVYSADNTGFIQLSMAYIMGASRIVLAGYDGYPPDRREHHCYDELPVEAERVRYEWQPGNEKETLMREAYTYAASKAKAEGVEMRLLTPSFLLGCLYERIGLEELVTG